MKKRILRCAAALLCACTVFGTGVTCYAATGTVSGTITRSKISGLYVYPEVGHKLTVQLDYFKRTKSGKLVEDTDGASVFGNNTSVSRSLGAGSGEKFDSLTVLGLVDDEIYAVSANLYP